MKKIAYLALSLAVALVLAVGVAFAAWNFETTHSQDSSLKSKRDDIFENYDIRKADESDTNRVKTYEMYLYPSTLYLNDYLDKLNGVKDVMPEEKYGYIEPVIKNGNVTYNVVSKNNGDNGYLNEVAKNATHTMSNAQITQGMYYDVYEKDKNWDITVENGLSDYVNIGNKSVKANSKFLYGDPTDDKTAVSYDKYVGSEHLNSSNGERHNWRNLHYYDRFGYWPTLKKDAGRYLPLKITIDEKFSNTFYNQVALMPFSDMGDPHDWYVYSFSCWSYVNYADSKYTPPYYATNDFATANKATNYINKDGTLNPSLGAFCPTTVSQYFDIMKSFEVYSDADNVIRLFPHFSNGKGYGATGSADTAIKNGGGDTIKVVPTYKNADGTAATTAPTDQHELYMFYTNEKGSVSSSNYTSTVRVSVLPNVEIDDYFSLNFRVALTNSPVNWGDWSDIYTLGRGNTAKTNLGLTDMLTQYGYGLYNLYLFVTDVAESPKYTYTSYNYTYISYIDALETMRQNIVNKSDKDNFPSLFGKNLLPVASEQVGGKSFMLVGEKVREAKFIDDVNFATENNSEPSDSVYTTDEQARDKYLATDQNFRLINKPLYGTPKGSETAVQVNSQFPYCYILQGVDFTKVTTQYFQIRFQRAYRPDLHFAAHEEYMYQNLQFAGTTYVHGFDHYFELKDAKVYSSENKSTSTQQVMKLTNEEMRGVYDIIMVFRSAREGNTDSPYAYNIGLYAYRHTDIFVKIFENDLTKTISYIDKGNGAEPSNDGTYKFIDHSGTTLFTKSYSIDVSIKPTDIDDNDKALASCINKIVIDKKYDPTKVKLYDHVTQAEVAYYKDVEDADFKDVEVVGTELLTYSNKKYQLVFHPFKIRKNYIFYIKIV